MAARRESWARVAAGSHQSTRSGAFAHFLNNNTSSSTSQPNRLSRSIDADGHDRMSTSWGRSGAALSYDGKAGYWHGLGGSAQVC
jgi:hypothetical protein